MTPEKNTLNTLSDDPGAVARKQDHIELAFKSRVEAAALDGRFYYEPMLSAHPKPGSLPEFPFLDAVFKAPLWVSSMTGGTAKAGVINHNLARACAQFGMGMGLGSCRQLLNSREYLADFDVRDSLGAGLPLFANLGVAQIEKLFEAGEQDRIPELLQLLRADGLIVHVNPLQEAMQPEGDQFRRAPIDVIGELLEMFDFKVIVKEVGQGFGPASLETLLRLPLAAVEFAAAGGTNFARLELLRSNAETQEAYNSIATVGHTAFEMLVWANSICHTLGQDCKTRHLIISGGIGDFLDGYYLVKKSVLPAVYGQASAFLRHAQGDYATLERFVEGQIRGLELAGAFLTVK